MVSYRSARKINDYLDLTKENLFITRKAENCDMENVKQKVFTKPLFAGWSQRFSGRCWVKLIDKTQGSDPTKQEYYWMRTLKSLYTDGLNIESDY